MLEEFESLTNHLAQTLATEIAAKCGDSGWSSGYLDVRYATDGKSWSSKIRVVMDRGGLESVDLTNDIDHVLIALNAQRRSLGEEWFGLLLAIESDMRCRLKLNYAPLCSDDETFLDD